MIIKDKIILIKQQLNYKALQPDLDYSQFTSHSGVGEMNLLSLQSRMDSALTLFCPSKRTSYHARFMLVNAPESELFLTLLQQTIKQKLPPISHTGYAYHVNENKVILTEAKSPQDNFAIKDNCLFSSWVDNETLFGCVRQPEEGHTKLEAGLVHKANGGVLILSLPTLLSQPTLWFRLKQMVLTQTFQWFSTDDSQPLPISIPSMPLDLRVILIGDRLSLADLQEFEPDFYQATFYTEFENELNIQSDNALKDWFTYQQFLAAHLQLPSLDPSCLPELVKIGTRYSEDQYYLPLSPDWSSSLLTLSAQLSSGFIDRDAVSEAIKQKKWQESYLVEKYQEAILSKQITINTQNYLVGQINGLSVIEYPGHPRMIGEPTRLSCVIHFGDGEFVDIERKNELAGNLHAKGMMIIQSFIMSEFAITHQLPFSASLVFEQSYSEVDGDSASLAGLCAFISALSAQPIDQQIAVTGSVDQFGHVQAIGGVNEKIEGFFTVCKHQGLTGQQGVIIPASNQRHLCLNDEVVEAVKNKQFSIWTVDHVADALYLLTKIPYKSENTLSLYKLIQTRIRVIMNLDKRPSHWLLKWRNR